MISISDVKRNRNPKKVEAGQIIEEDGIRLKKNVCRESNNESRLKMK